MNELIGFLVLSSPVILMGLALVIQEIFFPNAK